MAERKIDVLAKALMAAFGDALPKVSVALGECTAEVRHDRLPDVMRALRDRPEFRFEMLIDICGVDYSTYGDGARDGPRFASVCHLLSLANNQRLRVRAFAPDDDFPVLPSLIDVWPAANWF
jgi:NADH-quinone oxidoreductase subunit C